MSSFLVGKARLVSLLWAQLYTFLTAGKYFLPSHHSSPEAPELPFQPPGPIPASLPSGWAETARGRWCAGWESRASSLPDLGVGSSVWGNTVGTESQKGVGAACVTGLKTMAALGNSRSFRVRQFWAWVRTSTYLLWRSYFDSECVFFL